MYFVMIAIQELFYMVVALPLCRCQIINRKLREQENIR